MLQRVINFLYRHPKATLKKFSRFGGYRKYRSMIRSSEQMEAKAYTLPPINSYDDGLKIYFLTGKSFLYQTLFCIRSLVRVSGEKYCFILVDDGSFDPQLCDLISQKLPGALIITKELINEQFNNKLGIRSHPVLHKKREEYQHIKKLTDIHILPGDPWKLVLDSDMLFWDEPLEMIAWLKNPGKPIHMVDCNEAYGYSRSLMEELSGSKIRSLVNVGMIGLNSAEMDWNAIESWTSELEAKGGKTYYLEQALSAMIIGSQDAVTLDSEQYIVNPQPGSKGVLHHYVDLSKAIYFNDKWKLI